MAWHTWQKCKKCGGYRPTSERDDADEPVTGGPRQHGMGEDPPGRLCTCRFAALRAPDSKA